MLAIIGGTGIYSLDQITEKETITVNTPFGAPSSPIKIGNWGKQEILFLSRHGKGHQLLPHEINYRANIFALKKLGATQLISLSAVGSLNRQIEPGHLAIAEQYFDWTRGKRQTTFFGNGIAAHISTAKPASLNLTEWIAAGAKQSGVTLHTKVTYAGVEGPRLGTRAESLFLQQAGCHIVGMTNVPEAFLAREAQICYASIGIVTDYDCWMEDESQHVQATEIFSLYKISIGKVINILNNLMNLDLPAEESEIRHALSYALLTPGEQIEPTQLSWLAELRK